MKSNVSFSEDEKENILKKYKDGESIDSIGKFLHTHPQRVSNLLKAEGINTKAEGAKKAGRSKRGIGITSMTERCPEINKNISKEDIAYTAGLFDGEGCIYRRITETERPIYRLTISQNGREIHEWLLKIFGVGGIQRHGFDGHFSYTIGANKSIYQFLKMIEPHVKIKIKKLKLVVEELENKYGWGLQTGF